MGGNQVPLGAYKGFLRPGWCPVNESEPFSTFTTALPAKVPRYRPAELDRATSEDREKWKQDRYRFPPCACAFSNGFFHDKKGWRMLSIQEEELIMGLPLNFTEQYNINPRLLGHHILTFLMTFECHW